MSLAERVNELCTENERLREELAGRPRWVPVEERYPPEGWFGPVRYCDAAARLETERYGLNMAIKEYDANRGDGTVWITHWLDSPPFPGDEITEL